MRRIAGIALWLCLPLVPAGTAVAGEGAVDVILHARAAGIGPVRGDATMPMTVRMSGSRLRIDFSIPGGDDGYLLADTAGNRAWLVSVDGDVALPVPSPAWAHFRLDPDAPCAHMGARCEAGAVDVIANRLVRRWRYRGADGRGPDGTDNGTLWVDPRSGLLMAFRGRLAGRDDVRGYEVFAVEHGALEASLFELPRTLEQIDAANAPHTSRRPGGTSH
ncbi:hypothetical protein [Novilysobacter arseniciresistens]|uniref:hypothetical protein n=1 Tax=Novilysobacter arseniciresistens TaxID=1385522 RepID=UPI00068B7A51|nr:hypothetical protein [Lysobacter arseniciresistens]